MHNFDSLRERQHAERLLQHQVITQPEHERIIKGIAERKFSVARELSFFLVAGFLLFTTGLGILVYRHIDQAGHYVLIGLMGVASIVAFRYCFKNSAGYSDAKIASPGTIFDYSLLLANVLLLTLLQYLNFRSDLFGNSGLHYLAGGAFVIFAAYYFDHAGALAVGISAIATYFGIRLNVIGILELPEALALTSMLFAAVLEASGWILESKKIKAHFRRVYAQFSLHLFFISVIVLAVTIQYWYLTTLLTAAGFYWYKRYAFSEKSFFLMFFIFLYTYIMAGILIVRLVDLVSFSELMVYCLLLYFVISAALSIAYIKKVHKELKHAV